MKHTTVLRTALLVAVLATISLPSAHATAALRLFDGASCATSNCITITDTGVVTIVGTASATAVTTNPGFVSGNISVGSVFTLNVQTGISKPVLPNNQMDLHALSIVSSGPGGTLHVQWSDTNFTLVPSYAQADAGGTLTTGQNTVGFNTYWSASNTLFANTNLMTAQTFNTAAFGATAFGGAIATSPYSLMEELVITAKPGFSITSGDYSLTIVPEPTSMALLGGIVLVSVRAIRRKAKKTVV